MRRGRAARRRAARGLAAALYALVLSTATILGGCGGGTKTVTASGVGAAASKPASTASSRARRAPSTTSKAGAATSTAPSQTAPGGSTTRTAPEPAFAQNGGTGAAATSGAEVAAAVATVKAHEYTPNDTSEYHADQTLRVLTATRTSAVGGYGQRAFFFLDGRYIGTDTSEPSATVRVVSQGDTEVVLAYPLYGTRDPLCCPSGEAKVHFQLNNGRLVPLQPIPPVSSTSGLSRQ